MAIRVRSQLALILSFMTLPFLAFVNCSGGGGGGGAPVGGAPGKFVSLTEGSFTYSGTLPAKGTVAFVDHDGNTMVTLECGRIPGV